MCSSTSQTGLRALLPSHPLLLPFCPSCVEIWTARAHTHKNWLCANFSIVVHTYPKSDLVALVTKAQQGDQMAWNGLVDRFDNLVWSIVRGFRMSNPDACDVAQVTWLRALENLDRIRDPERIGLWLATTARRECMRVLERGARTVPVDPHKQLTQVRVERDFTIDVADYDESRRVVDALDSLGNECQQLLRLVLCDPPFSYSEISEILEIAVGTIGPRRQRCLSRLRAAI